MAPPWRQAAPLPSSPFPKEPKLRALWNCLCLSPQDLRRDPRFFLPKWCPVGEDSTSLQAWSSGPAPWVTWKAGPTQSSSRRSRSARGSGLPLPLAEGCRLWPGSAIASFRASGSGGSGAALQLLLAEGGKKGRELYRGLGSLQSPPCGYAKAARPSSSLLSLVLLLPTSPWQPPPLSLRAGGAGTTRSSAAHLPVAMAAAAASPRRAEIHAPRFCNRPSRRAQGSCKERDGNNLQAITTKFIISGHRLPMSITNFADVAFCIHIKHLGKSDRKMPAMMSLLQGL